MILVIDKNGRQKTQLASVDNLTLGAPLVTQAAGVTVDLQQNGAGTVVLPAAGTVAMLNQANVFTAAQTIQTGSLMLFNTAGTGSKFRLGGLSGVPDWGGVTLNVSYNGTAWDLDNTALDGWFFKLDTRAQGDSFQNGLWLYRVPAGANPHTNEYAAMGITDGRVYFRDKFGIGTETTLGQLTVKTALADTIGLVIDTVATPTANLMELRNNTVAKFTVGPEGNLIIEGSTSPLVHTKYVGANFNFMRFQAQDAATPAATGYTDLLTRVASSNNGTFGIEFYSDHGHVGTDEKAGIRVHPANHFTSTIRGLNIFTDNGRDIRFILSAAGVYDFQPADVKMTLKNNGHLLIGTATDGAQLAVKAANSSTVGLLVDTAATPTVPAFKIAHNTTDRYSMRVTDKYVQERPVSYSIADLEIVTLGNLVAVVELMAQSASTYGRFLIKGPANLVTELENPDAYFSTTKGTANKINVYYEASSYHIQNLRGASQLLGIKLTVAAGAA